LQTVATVMTDFPTCRFLLEGHTDATGPEEYDLDLSNRRAHAVEEHLRTLKVEPELLSAVGYGETQLLFPEAPPTPDNRWVEIAIGGWKRPDAEGHRSRVAG
jgi:outer membrane protein OmpA-like peptidoglycan-associated protein